MTLPAWTPGDAITATRLQDMTDAINKAAYTEGFLPYAMAYGLPNNPVSDSSNALTAVSSGDGGIALIPFVLPGPMKLASIMVRNGDTASARSAEGRLYRSIGTGALQFVTGTDCTWSFTPSGADNRSANIATSGTLLIPGAYWLAIRNTSTTQTFNVRKTLNSSELSGTIAYTATGPALGSVFSWSSPAGAGGQYLARLQSSSAF